MQLKQIMLLGYILQLFFGRKIQDSKYYFPTINFICYHPSDFPQRYLLIFVKELPVRGCEILIHALRGEKEFRVFVC